MEKPYLNATIILNRKCNYSQYDALLCLNVMLSDVRRRRYRHICAIRNFQGPFLKWEKKSNIYWPYWYELYLTPLSSLSPTPPHSAALKRHVFTSTGPICSLNHVGSKPSWSLPRCVKDKSNTWQTSFCINFYPHLKTRQWHKAHSTREDGETGWKVCHFTWTTK